MPQQFGDPSKGHDCREGSSSFFFQQLVLSEHMAKKITNPKGGRIVTRQDCSRHVKITRTHLFLLTCFVILIYLYLTISSVNLQPINEDFEVLRSNNNDLVLLEMKRKRVIEGEYSGKIPSERNSQKVHSARQEQQHTSLLRRPSDYKSSEAHIVKLSISADQSNRLKGQFYRQPNNTTSDNVLQKISNHNYNVYAHLQRDKDPTNKSNQENGSIPPAFQNIASFPSERRTGDIPIVSQGSSLFPPFGGIICYASLTFIALIFAIHTPLAVLAHTQVGRIHDERHTGGMSANDYRKRSRPPVWPFKG